MINQNDSLWKLATAAALVMLLLVLLGSKPQPLGICMYEALYDAPEQSLVVGWMPQPCNHLIDISNPVMHEQLLHSRASGRCGKVYVRAHPALDAPLADTFPQLCGARARAAK